MARDALDIPIEHLVEPPDPMRFAMDDAKFEELCQSIRAVGILQSLLVIPRNDVYEVVAGHRRLLAARQVGLASVPCRIFHGEADNKLAIMIAENLHREDVSPVEEGELYKKVSETPGITEEAMQQMIRQPLGYIYARINLVNGCPEVALAVHQQRIGLGVAQELNKVKNDGYRKMYLARACEGGCTIAVAKTWVSTWRMSDNGATPYQQQPAEPLPGPEHVAQPMACWLCNGRDDNWNLEPVWIHREELRMLRMARQQVVDQENAQV